MTFDLDLIVKIGHHYGWPPTLIVGVCINDICVLVPYQDQGKRSPFCFHSLICTLSRKAFTSFVRSKPWGSVVITKSLPLRLSLCACKASWLYYMALYHSIMLYQSLCFTKGTVNSYYSRNKWNTTCNYVCSGIYFVVINSYYNPL